MKSPILAAFAPGEEAVAGKIVSPTSSKKEMSFGVRLRLAPNLLSPGLQPDKKASAPMIVPLNRSATLDKASRLFIIKNLLVGYKINSSVFNIEIKILNNHKLNISFL